MEVLSSDLAIYVESRGGWGEPFFAPTARLAAPPWKLQRVGDARYGKRTKNELKLVPSKTPKTHPWAPIRYRRSWRLVWHPR